MTSTFPKILDPGRFQGRWDGRPLGLHILRTPEGRSAAICNHGARLLQLVMPGRGGHWQDVVLGYDSAQQMLDAMASMGAVIGRFANRIGHARFMLDASPVSLPANDGQHCLHGGPAGSRHRVFDVTAQASDRLELAWCFRQADDGFPGDLHLQVTYTLRDPGVLTIEWWARALDLPTVVNITTHPFFNLEGQGSGNIHDHHISIDAGHYLPVDAGRIPTGEVASVNGTPLDLRAGALIGQALTGMPAGFDHCYAFEQPTTGLRRMARVQAPISGIVMETWSDAPGLQFFSCSGFDGSLPRHAGKAGRTYQREAAFCLEPQGFPDAPNQPHFPDTSLRPGQSRSGRIEYRFSVAH